MKKYVFIFTATLLSGTSFAQNATESAGSGSTMIDNLGIFLGAGAAATFLFIVVYVLSKAIKALSAQVASRR